jgi:hypothetical protein
VDEEYRPRPIPSTLKISFNEKINTGSRHGINIKSDYLREFEAIIKMVLSNKAGGMVWSFDEKTKVENLVNQSLYRDGINRHIYARQAHRHTG